MTQTLKFCMSEIEDESPALVTIRILNDSAKVDIKANSPDVLLGGQVVDFLKSVLK